MLELIKTMWEEFRVEEEARIKIHIMVPDQKPESASQTTTHKKSKAKNKEDIKVKEFLQRLHDEDMGARWNPHLALVGSTQGGKQRRA